MSIRAYNKYFFKNIYAKSFYWADITLTNFYLIIQVVISIFFGLAVNSANSIQTVNELLIYYLFGVGFISNFQRFNPVGMIDNLVVSGNIAQHFLKPYNFFKIVFVQWLSDCTYKSLISFSVTLLFVKFYFGGSWGRGIRILAPANLKSIEASSVTHS